MSITKCIKFQLNIIKILPSRAQKERTDCTVSSCNKLIHVSVKCNFFKPTLYKQCHPFLPDACYIDSGTRVRRGILGVGTEYLQTSILTDEIMRVRFTDPVSVLGPGDGRRRVTTDLTRETDRGALRDLKVTL